MFDSLKVAVSGINHAVNRIAAAAQNIANAQSAGRLPTAENPQPTSYKPIRAESLQVPGSGNGPGLGVVSTFVPVEPSYQIASDPDSPHANEDGLVAVPNVDLATQIVEAKMAEIAYKANASLIGTIDKMEKRLLDELK